MVREVVNSEGLEELMNKMVIPCERGSLLTPEPPLHPLMIEHILDSVCNHLETKELLSLRLVAMPWNEAVLRTFQRRQASFCFKFHHPRDVSRLVTEKEGEELARKVLKKLTKACKNMGASTRLNFKKLIIDRDFYLGPYVWKYLAKFMAVAGINIRSLLISIRPLEFTTETKAYIEQCTIVMPKEAICIILESVPNLESLSVCVRFANYCCQVDPKWSLVSIFPQGEAPMIESLTKLHIQEPLRVSYDAVFLRELIGLSPNINSFGYTPSTTMTTVMAVLETFRPDLNEFVIGNADLSDESLMGIRDYHLTQLEVISLQKSGNILRRLLLDFSFSLTILKLGGLELKSKMTSRITLPQMVNLTDLHVNLTMFPMDPISSYGFMFPSLDTLTFACYAGMQFAFAADNYGYYLEDDNNLTIRKFETIIFSIRRFLPREPRHSPSCSTFRLIGEIRGTDRGRIRQAVRATFPNADHYFE